MGIIGNTLGSNKPTTFQSFDSFGGGSGLSSAQTEELLRIAIAQGGAVGQVAEELVHPDRSILATVGDKFKQSFSTFVDIISAPSQVVAGAISPDVSVGEAIKENVQVSDVLFGESQAETAMEKTGSFVTRLAVDVLTDPLTYVTFGAGAGIWGVRAGIKVAAGPNLARVLKIPEGSLVQTSEKGQELIQKYIAMQERGLRATILKNEQQALVNAAKQKGILNPHDDAVKQIKALDDELQENLIRETIGVKELAKIQDEAKDVVSRMLNKNPALSETLVDRGGIKFLGQSIIAGKQIRNAIQLVPGMSKLDLKTQPVRNLLGSLFNRETTLSGKVPEEEVLRIQKWQDLADSQRNQLFNEVPALWRSLGITREEDELIRAAIELDKLPSDPKLAELWKAMKGYNVDNEDVVERLLPAARFRQKRERVRIKQAWDSGIRVTEIPHHIRHFLDQEEIKAIPFSTPPSSKLGSAKMAKIAKFRNLKTGEEIIGSAESLKLKPKFKAQEIQRIKDNLNTFLERKGVEVKEFNDEIKNLVGQVESFFKGKVDTEFRGFLNFIDIKDQYTVKAFLETIQDTLDDIGVEKMVTKRAKQSLKEGVKIKPEQLDDLSQEAFEALQKRLQNGELELAGQIDDFNIAIKLAKVASKRKKKSVHAEGVEGELRDLAKKLKINSISARKSAIADELDSEAVARVLNDMLTHFRENPTGVTRMLDSIIGRKQKISEILHDIELERLAAKTDLEALPDKARFFEGMDGETFERVRATVEDAESIGIRFDKSAISTEIKSSLEVIKATSMKQFMDEVAAKAGVVASKAPPGYRAISVKGIKEADGAFALSNFVTGKNGEELFFHPETAKRIENFMGSVINDEATNELMKQYDKLQNLWKASVTSIFPAFHGRNAISNVFLHFLDIGYHSLNPSNHVFSAQLIQKEHQFNNLSLAAAKGDKLAKEKLALLQAKVMFKDRAGHEWTYGELRKVIKDNVVAFNPGLVGALDVTQTTPELVRELQDDLFVEGVKKGKRLAKDLLPVSQRFFAFRGGRKVGNMVEEQARLISFIANLKNTGDVGLSAARTKQFLFDYQNLSGFEKTVMRRLIPFYTFTRKNLELQVKTLLTTPGRTGGVVHSLTTLGDVLGGRLSEEDKQKLPDYLREGMIILADQEGQNLELLRGIESPIEQPFKALQPNMLLGSLSPIIRIPTEQMSGYSFFHGKALSDVTNAAAFKSAPDAVKDFIGFTTVNYTTKDNQNVILYTSLRPERLHLLLNLPPTSRVLSSLKQVQTEDVDASYRILQFLTGIRPLTVNSEIEAAKREKELRKAMEEVLQDAGVGYTFEKFIINED